MAEPTKVKGFPFIIGSTIFASWCLLANNARYAGDPRYTFWQEFGKLSQKEKWLEPAYIQFMKDYPNEGATLKSSKSAYHGEIPALIVGFVAGVISGPSLPGFAHYTQYKGGRIMTRVSAGGLLGVIMQWVSPAIFSPSRQDAVKAFNSFNVYLSKSGLPANTTPTPTPNS
jgi:hypothetical protein